MRRFRLVFIIAAALGCSAVLAPSAGAFFAASGSDPVGDSTDSSPARDLVGFSLAYDRRSGDLIGEVRLAGDPARETSAFITFAAGRRIPGGACEGYPAIGFGAYTTDFGASWLRMAGPGSVTASGDAVLRGYMDRNPRFEAKAKQLRGLKPNCVIAILSESDNPANIYDTAGPVQLKGQPELGLKVTGAKSKIRPGSSRKYRVTIFNRGDAPTGRVRVKIGRIARFKVQPRRRTLASVRPGARRSFSVRLTPAARASTLSHLKVTARARKQIVDGELDVWYRRPAPKTRGGGGGEYRPGVCNRYLPDLSGTTGGSLTLVPC